MQTVPKELPDMETSTRPRRAVPPARRTEMGASYSGMGDADGMDVGEGVTAGYGVTGDEQLRTTSSEWMQL